MKIKVLLEGLLPLILIPLFDFQLRLMIILLCLMGILQFFAFLSKFWDQKRQLGMKIIYTICQSVFFIECGVQLNKISVFYLYFICIQIGQVRINDCKWNKIAMVINFYSLVRISEWNQIDCYIFGAGLILLLFSLYTDWVYKQENEVDVQQSYIFKKSQEKSIQNIVPTPEYKRQQQFHSSTNLIQQQELQECFHFFNLIPDSLVLLTAQNLTVHFCNAATLELFKISDMSNFRSCLEQLTDIVSTQNKSETRDPRDSLPSFHSFQQSFQQYKINNPKQIKEDHHDINQILSDLSSIQPNKRFFQILKSSPHNTIYVGSYLAKWYENTCCVDLEQPEKKRLLEINAHATLVDEKLMILLQIRDVTHRDYISLVKKSYQAKSNIISFVSHEYRTPLNSIIQFISALQEEKDVNLQSKYLKIALSNCKYLLNLSNDLLDFAQLKAGKFSISPIEMDLQKLIEECLELFRLEASLKKIKLSLIYRKSAPRLLNNDPNRIRQIIINLLGNAFKFTLQGQIEIRVSNYLNNSIKLEIHDTGQGIKEEHKENLMQAFSKVDDKESKRLNPQGVGLGLLISNMIARNLSKNDKGLQFQSEYQNGSSFWFYISKNVQDTEIKEELDEIDEESPERRQSLWRYNNIKSQRESKCRCVSILVVDDNAFNIEVLKFLLMKISPSIQFDCTLDGYTAIQMVKMNRCKNCNGYDLIFMDIDMPTMNGIQTTLILKKQFPKIQIIGCSAYSKKEEEQLALQNGMDGYLVKPIQIDQLKAFLRSKL
ncbi:unnamed protein product [Paramecium sonneborni]|uniref:Uncharacterized protein n=1 Tax=Paramecium sonneborni TaxID=65129 RepID=A0A8S1QCL5_9CILI|nr:unnamed protein product [Paramecium sonneborni]